MTGSSIGIVASLAGPSVIKPRSCPCLPNFRPPHNNIPLKHPCDCTGGSLKETVRETSESLIIIGLVEVLPEFLFLPCDSCARNTCDMSINHFMKEDIDKSFHTVKISRWVTLAKRRRFGPEAQGMDRGLKPMPETGKWQKQLTR